MENGHRIRVSFLHGKRVISHIYVNVFSEGSAQMMIYPLQKCELLRQYMPMLGTLSDDRRWLHGSSIAHAVRGYFPIFQRTIGCSLNSLGLDMIISIDLEVV